MSRRYQPTISQRIRLITFRLVENYGVDISSDHHLLIANILLKIASIQINRDEAERMFDVSNLSDPGCLNIIATVLKAA